MRLIDADKMCRELCDESHGMISDESLRIYQILRRLDEQPTIKVEPTLRKLLNGEWVDTEEVQTAFGIDFATGMSLFELSREAVWNAPPLNGQKITTKFRLKAEPVKRGRWVEKEDAVMHCTECDRIGNPRIDNYCSRCGARMDGGEK